MYADFPEPFNATENKFEFGVAFMQIRPYRYRAHDPRIGQINMRMVQMNSQGEEIIFEKFPYEIGPCDPEVNFVNDSTDNTFRQNITKFTCL